MARVLIVDDSACVQKILGTIIIKGGHEVVGRATDGESALELFKLLHPELVTLDYMMAGKDGEEVLEEMIDSDPSTRVIMVAGSEDHAVEEKALKSGAKKFITKARVRSDLLKVIDQVMTN